MVEETIPEVPLAEPLAELRQEDQEDKEMWDKYVDQQRRLCCPECGEAIEGF